jgi:hypothetical protein
MILWGGQFWLQPPFQAAFALKYSVSPGKVRACSLVLK